MVLYITNFNYMNLLHALDLNIPREYQKEFYENYKLTHFEDLDKSFFSNSMARVLVISDILSKNLNNLEKRMFFIRKSTQMENQYLRSNVMPAYHYDKNCEYLNSDYRNVLLPKSLKEEKANEYRDFFINTKRELGNNPPRDQILFFCNELIKRFDLKETDIQMYNNHYYEKTIAKNSGVKDIADEEIKKISRDIEKLIEYFHHISNNKDISKKISFYLNNPLALLRLFFDEKYDFYNTEMQQCNNTDYLENLNEIKRKSIDKKELDNNLYEFIESLPEALKNGIQRLREKLTIIFEHKKKITKDIINFHFYHTYQGKLNIDEKYLVYAGFKLCSHCAKKINNDIQKTNNPNDDWDEIPF